MDRAKPKIIYTKVITGYKKDNTKIVYKLNFYNFYDDVSVKKKLDTLERKIIRLLSNRKLFLYFDCDIIEYDERGKIKQCKT